MKRDAEERVLRLCEQQLAGFDEHAWLGCRDVGASELAAVALFLAQGPGQALRAELESVAERLHPGSTGHLSTLVVSTGFDPGRFATLLNARLRHARAS